MVFQGSSFEPFPVSSLPLPAETYTLQYPNLFPLLLSPQLLFTVTFPVSAPAGTSTVIFFSDQLATAAPTPG